MIAKTHSVCLGEAFRSSTNNRLKHMPSKRVLTKPVERRPIEQSDTAMTHLVRAVLASVYKHAATKLIFCYRCKKYEVQMCRVCDNKECKIWPFASDDFWGEQIGVHWLGERCIEFMVCNTCGQSMFRCPYCGAITKHALDDHVTADLGAVLSAEPTEWTFNDNKA